MYIHDVIIIGGGAAGMFATAVLAGEASDLKVLVLEKESKPLAKVRGSGGGRCNLTHAGSDIRGFSQNYPRGSRELIGPLHRFGSAETIQWFEAHGVPLVTFDDGCVFPRSDRSEDVIRALCAAARRGAVEIRTDAECSKVRKSQGLFAVALASGEQLHCRKLLVATGGGAFVDGLDHTIEPCLPSLFTFSTSDRAFTALAGIVVAHVCVNIANIKAEGALLITHDGVSGPAVLKLSSFGARMLAEADYRFEIKIHWIPALRTEEIFHVLERQRVVAPRKQIGTWSPLGLSSRLWKFIVVRAGVDDARPWGGCSSNALRQVAAHVGGFVLPVTGKNPHRAEFVTCGGIRRSEVDFKTMESRRHPGLYFAGEVLDVDGMTGGFNLQAAWTTGFLAAQALRENALPGA